MIKKMLHLIILFLFIGFFSLAAILQTASVKEYVRGFLIDTIEAETGYIAEIGEIHLYPSFSISLNDVTLKENDQPFCKLQQIDCRLHISSLWSDTIHLSTLDLSGINLLNPSPIEMDQVRLRDIFFEESESRLQFAFSLDQWLNGGISYEKGHGTIQLEIAQKGRLSGDYLLSKENILRIPRFHASYDAISIDGNLSVTLQGEITNSQFILSTENLSSMLPITGQAQGKGKIIGDIWAPQIEGVIQSEALDFKGHILENVSAHIALHRPERGQTGKLELAFVKDRHPFEFSGDLSWRPPVGKIAFSTDLSELAQLFSLDLTNIEGPVEMELEVTPKNISTSAHIKNGIIENFEFGSVISNISANLKGDHNKLIIENFKAKDGKSGKFTGSGEVFLDPEKNFPYSLNLQLDQAEVIQLDDVKGNASGNLSLKGNAEEATLSGTITTDSIRIKLPEKPQAVAETVDVKYINVPEDESLPTPFRHPRPDWPLNLDLVLRVPDNAKVKGMGLSSEWKGEITIKGTPQTLITNGEFNLIEGKYLFRGKNVKLAEGSLLLAGDPKKKATLFVKAEMEIDRLTIEAIVKGPLENTAISLRSSPPMSQREILSWLLFNRGISDISSFQGTQLDQSMISLSNTADDGPDLLTRIGNTLGIDSINIGGSPTEAKEDVSYQVGKYLNDRTFISVSSQVTRNKKTNQKTRIHCLGIETDLGKNIKLQGELDNGSNGQLNLLWKRDY